MSSLVRIASRLVVAAFGLALVPVCAWALPGESVEGELGYRVDTTSTTINGVCWLQNPGDPSCFTDNGTTVAADAVPNTPVPFTDAIQYVGLATTRADQDLAILATSVVATGSHIAGSGCGSVEVPPFFATYTTESASSSSDLRVEFDVVESSQYDLSGALSSNISMAFGMSSLDATSASVRLEHAAGGVLSEDTTLLSDLGCAPAEVCTDSQAIDSTGMLAPGRYALVAEATGRANCLVSISTNEIYDQTQESAFDVTLTIVSASALPVVSPVAAGALACLLAVAGLRELRATGR